MNHIHLKECESTQEYLINLQKDPSAKYLISTDSQVKGRGRRENLWDSDKNSLCFSFSLKPNKILTLSASEITILLCQFFSLYKNSNHQTKLKWPNDLINFENKKCGGVLINKIDDMLIVGIGLNLNPSKYPTYQIEAGSILKTHQEFQHKSLALEIVEYIHNNRISASEIYKKWKDFCFHLNTKVSILEEDKVTEGIFLNIGEFGQAIIQTQEKEVQIFNGSLRVHH